MQGDADVQGPVQGPVQGDVFDAARNVQGAGQNGATIARAPALRVSALCRRA